MGSTGIDRAEGWSADRLIASRFTGSFLSSSNKSRPFFADPGTGHYPYTR